MRGRSKKRKWRRLRYRKDDLGHNVLVAVSRWIRGKGGTAVVIGGIEVQEWPGEGEFNYRIAIRCTGKKPIKEGQADAQPL